MEIQPPISYQLSNSKYGLFPANKMNSYRLQTILTEPNRLEDNANLRANSIIEESLEKAFKRDELIKATAAINRPPQYPFQSLEDFYPKTFRYPNFLNDDIYNMNENVVFTMGRPSGSADIDLPEKVLIDNLMKLKEYQANSSILFKEYAQNLLKFETEVGANYYINQLENEQKKLGEHARKRRRTSELPPIVFKSQLPMGKVDLQGVVTPQVTTFYSPNAANANTSFRQHRMAQQGRK